MDVADQISIQFYNTCAKTSFSQAGDLTGYSQDLDARSFSRLPEGLLISSGMQSMVLNTNAVPNLFNGTNWISLGWKNDATDYRFGVKILVPAQVMGMGERPYYQVATGYGSGPPWTTPVDDPAKPYALSPVVEVQMQMTPTSYHTGLSVVVTLKDPA